MRALAVLVAALLVASCGTEELEATATDARATEDSRASEEASTDSGAPDTTAIDAADVLDVPATPLPHCGTAPGLRGAFLQLTNARPALFWGRSVDAMASLGMTDVIVQTVAYPPVGGAPNAVNPANIRAVLDAAKTHRMRVLVGLAQSEGNGDPAKAADATFIATLIERSKQSAGEIVAAYGAHEAFDGFFLSMEPWTPSTSTELGRLPEYVQKVSVHARSIAPHAVRIAMSPFVSGGALRKDPALTETVYREMLATASIDVIMLQDGVGALGLSGAAIADVTPLFRAMKTACSARSVALWANVETFAWDATGAAQPTTFERLSLQLRAVSDTTVDVVTFEFSGNMFAESGAAARALNDGYRAACTFTPR